MKCFHQFHDCNVWAVVDELVISIGGVGPAPRVGESVELRLAYLPARLAKEDVVIGVRVKRRIEIDKIDARVRKFLPIRENSSKLRDSSFTSPITTSPKTATFIAPLSFMTVLQINSPAIAIRATG